MIRVTVEVDNAIERLAVVVEAQDIRRAVELAGRRYPGSALRVVFPIDPDEFFVKTFSKGAGLLEVEGSEATAGGLGRQKQVTTVRRAQAAY